MPSEVRGEVVKSIRLGIQTTSVQSQSESSSTPLSRLSQLPLSLPTPSIFFARQITNLMHRNYTKVLLCFQSLSFSFLALHRTSFYKPSTSLAFTFLLVKLFLALRSVSVDFPQTSLLLISYFLNLQSFSVTFDQSSTDYHHRPTDLVFAFAKRANPLHKRTIQPLYIETTELVQMHSLDGSSASVSL